MSEEEGGKDWDPNDYDWMVLVEIGQVLYVMYRHLYLYVPRIDSRDTYRPQVI